MGGFQLFVQSLHLIDIKLEAVFGIGRDLGNLRAQAVCNAVKVF